MGKREIEERRRKKIKRPKENWKFEQETRKKNIDKTRKEHDKYISYILLNIWSASCPELEYLLITRIVVTVSIDSPIIRQEIPENLNNN